MNTGLASAGSRNAKYAASTNPVRDNTETQLDCSLCAWFHLNFADVMLCCALLAKCEHTPTKVSQCTNDCCPFGIQHGCSKLVGLKKPKPTKNSKGSTATSDNLLLTPERSRRHEVVHELQELERIKIKLKDMKCSRSHWKDQRKQAATYLCCPRGSETC